MFVPVELKGMSRVRATLKTGYNVIIWGKDIDNFAFAFIAPLEA